MTDNGESRPKREKKVGPENTPLWLVSHAEALKAAHEMATRFGPERRKRYEREAYAALMTSDHAWRFMVLRANRRKQMCECFVSVMEDHGDQEMFRTRLKEYGWYGFNPMLIWLLASIAWKIFIFYWEHIRKEAV